MAIRPTVPTKRTPVAAPVRPSVPVKPAGARSGVGRLQKAADLERRKPLPRRPSRVQI